MMPHTLLLDFKDAWKNLIRKPLRSMLSGLGIGIGVAALIAMLSVTEGAKLEAYDKFSSLGLHTLRIEALAATRGESGRLANLSQGLNREDDARIAEWLGARGKVGVFNKKENIGIGAGNRTVAATVIGANAEWFAAEGLNVARGRLFDDRDVASQANYCVVGSELAAALRIDLLSAIKLDNRITTVVGIAEKKGRLLTEGTGLSALDFDNAVIMPISVMPFARIVAGRLLVDGLVIHLDTADERMVRQTAGQIQSILLDNHRQVEDFHVVVPVTLLREAENSQKVFSRIMGAIAALSLLVGGIGVMNIMLANIAEQTREIGLRMAVGASPARITSLYLCHSILLTLSGAAWGIGVGGISALMIEKIAGLAVVLSPFSLFVAPTFAIVTGIVFGLHPARRAASLEPALALRDS